MKITTVEGNNKFYKQEHIQMNNLDETLEKVRLFFILAENESNEKKPDTAFVERHIRWAKDQLYIYTSEISKRAYIKKTMGHQLREK